MNFVTTILLLVSLASLVTAEIIEEHRQSEKIYKLFIVSNNFSVSFQLDKITRKNASKTKFSANVAHLASGLVTTS